MFDLAGALHPARLERALDNTLARHLTTVVALGAITLELAKHGRPGSALMRTLLAERGADYVAPESGLEARFLSLLRDNGLPEPDRQVDVGGDQWVGRVDFVFPGRRLVIEVDSSMHHSAALDREADRRRDADLWAAGYRVLRITDDQIWFRPRQVVAEVRFALAPSAA
ncbi:MAG: endonuclease domain-containing protein [Actinomycetota bacterium]|nr:endonuclease domain-containing protein [Actinomycetota bacterium]